MPMDAAHLHNAVAQVAPVVSAKVGNPNDKNTWSVTYDASATPGQIAQGQAIINNGELLIAQANKQDNLDVLLVTNADMVRLVQGGNSTTTTGAAVSTYLSNATNNYRSLRAQIAAATTVAQVAAININAGWPPNP